MIRPITTEMALFLVPFILYALFLWAARARVIDLGHWSMPTLAWLTIAALVLMLGSFFVLAQFSGAPSRSTYIPAHMENGKFVPGTIR
jgi:hypothetical protein